MEKANKSYNLLIGFVILTLIIILITIVGYFLSKPEGALITGEVESNECRVSGKVTGRIDSIAVKLGDKVSKGDTLVFIYAPDIQAKVSEAKAVESGASAIAQKALNGARKEEIQGAYEVWQQAVTYESVMKKSFDRIQKLYDQKVISAQKYDETKAGYDASVAQAKAAKSQYDMAVNGARREDKEAAMAQKEQAKGALQEVNAYMQDLCLTAPCDGYVTEIYPKLGELVQKGNKIMDITDPNDLWFTFNVREDDMHGMKAGDKVKIQIPFLNNKEVTATVSMINLRDTYATWKATTETKGYDMKTYEVRAVPDSAIEGLRIGVSAILESPKNPNRNKQ
jgi:HlyD family secretion protein